MPRIVYSTEDAGSFTNAKGQVIPMVAVTKYDPSVPADLWVEHVEKNGPYDPSGTGYRPEIDKE